MRSDSPTDAAGGPPMKLEGLYWPGNWAKPELPICSENPTLPPVGPLAVPSSYLSIDLSKFSLPIGSLSFLSLLVRLSRFASPRSRLLDRSSISLSFLLLVCSPSSRRRSSLSLSLSLLSKDLAVETELRRECLRREL